MSRLVLVDGSSYLFRAYHALPDLRTPKGEPTGAMVGVLSMLKKLIAAEPPDYIAVVFDAPEKTFRHEWFPEYKAHRPPTPDDLVAQIAPLYECIRAQGLPLVVVPGVEADDVIGTLARQAEERGIATWISTSDKDMAQLVSPLITCVNTMSNERLDQEGVRAKFQVTPEQMTDYLTLIGDTSDNVPGVPKVGPKTAVKWLQTFHTLDRLLENAETIKGVVGENLRASRDFLPLSKKLVTIKTDCVLPVTLDDLAFNVPPNVPNTEKLKELYTHYAFKNLESLSDTPHSSQPKNTAHLRAAVTPAPRPHSLLPEAPPPADIRRTDYETVNDEAALDRWIHAIQKADLTAIDLETTSLDLLSARIVGIALAVDHRACYIPIAHERSLDFSLLSETLVLSRLKPWLQDERALKVGQNIKFDQHVFANHGILLKGIAHDTMLQSYVLESHLSHDMDALALRHLAWRTIAYTDVTGKGAKSISFSEVPIDRATEYAAEDADVTWRLHHVLYPRLTGAPQLASLYQNMEMPTREILYRMERAGVLIDADLLRQQSHTLGTQLLALEDKAYALAGQPFNLASPKQLGEILFNKMGLPPVKKTATGQPSTDEDVLQTLAADYPLPQVLLSHRTLSKLKSTYTDKLPKVIHPGTGRVHTTFSQTTAVTGRLASSEPNLQNIPVRREEGRKIREAFIAPQGWVLLSADYSQIELRIMAHLSRDEGLIAAFRAGADIHRATAAEVFGCAIHEVSDDQRRMIKAVNFGLIYGMSAFGLARELSIERSAAQHFIESYFKRYPGVARYMDHTRETARHQGFVETLFGRRLTLENITGGNAIRRAAAERAAINAPMQGTAADLIKMAMVATQQWLDQQKLLTRMLLQVHDELVFEVPEHELDRVRETLPSLMEGVAALSVPLVVNIGVGQNWDQAH
ncbi:MAG: DNA polymerase I [Burkholderiales bacterium]|jgi:DNA polymerase-1|nr:DNA polymerase I [Burkholderiales bacterium]